MGNSPKIQDIRSALSVINSCSADALHRIVEKQGEITREEEIILRGIEFIKLVLGLKLPPNSDQTLEMRRQAYALEHELTRTQMKIFFLAAEQKTTPEIAEALHLSPQTVKKHLSRAFQKTGLKDRKDVIAQTSKDNLV